MTHSRRRRKTTRGNYNWSMAGPRGQAGGSWFPSLEGHLFLFICFPFHMCLFPAPPIVQCRLLNCSLRFRGTVSTNCQFRGPVFCSRTVFPGSVRLFPAPPIVLSARSYLFSFSADRSQLSTARLMRPTPLPPPTARRHACLAKISPRIWRERGGGGSLRFLCPKRFLVFPIR